MDFYPPIFVLPQKLYLVTLSLPFFFFLINRLDFFRAVLSLQKNWAEITGSSHIPPLSLHSFPYYFTSLVWYSCYIPILFSSPSDAHHLPKAKHPQHLRPLPIVCCLLWS